MVRMRDVSDEFLLGVGGMSATLVGLFLVGMFFYAETALRRGESSRAPMAAYIRDSARIVLILYAIPIALSMTLVVLDDQWSRIVFAALSLLLIWANVGTVRRLAAIQNLRQWPLLVATEVFGTLVTIAIVAAPWVLAGLQAGRPELTLSLLLSFGAGFLGIYAMALTAFDLVRSTPVATENAATPAAPTPASPSPAAPMPEATDVQPTSPPTSHVDS